MSQRPSDKKANRVRNDRFDNKNNFDLGRPRLMFALWYFFKCGFFLSPLPWPTGLKLFLLRRFGAKVGRGIYIKPRVNIHIPWKLEIGDYVWIGEEALILNLAHITIGSHVCISQRAFLCAGNHDYRDEGMKYMNRPIVIEDGAWIGAQVFVAAGTTVGFESVVTAGSIVTRSLPAEMICSGYPCKPIKARWPA